MHLSTAGRIITFVPYTMSFITEYRRSLKIAGAEETLDLVFYRPLAFGIVKAIYRLPVTPNQITFLSFAAGMVAAWYFSVGSAAAYTAAAVWLIAANVLDCCDGQLARLQGSGTPMGRIIDGLADYCISVAVFIALGIGLTARSSGGYEWWLVLAVALTSMVHAFMFDYRQQQCIRAQNGESGANEREVARIEGVIAARRQQPGGFPARIVLKFYLAYMRMQCRLETARPRAADPRTPQDLQARMRLMRWWSLLGTTTNRSLLIAAAFAHAPMIYLWVVITAGNAWLLAGILLQRRLDRRMTRQYSITPSPSSLDVRGNTLTSV